MKLWAAVGCLLVFFIVCDAYFNCRRSGLSCVNGNCNITSGECDCPDGFEGPDCGLNSSLISTDCPSPCDNGGTCYQDADGVYGCYCTENFIGDICEIPRAELGCNGENMTITITPYPGFRGFAYIAGQEDDPDCELEEILDGSELYLETTLSLREGCGAVVKNDTPTEGDFTFHRDVVLQYHPYFSGPLDQIVEVECTYTEKNVSDAGGSLPSISVDRDRVDLEKETAVSKYEPVKFLVQDRAGNEITFPVYVTQELRMYIYLTDTSVYKTINVEMCEAENGLTGSKFRKESLIEDSCPVSYEIIEWPIQPVDDQAGIIINFKGFKFRRSDGLVIKCNVRHCKEGDNRCAPKTCNNYPNTGYGKRRRRDADAEGDVVISKRMTVLDPAAKQLITDNSNYPEDCIQRTEILTSIIILATAIVILFLVCFFLALKLMKSRPKYVNNETESSDGSQLRIPRVRAVF